jgi:hypothetical protein
MSIVLYGVDMASTRRVSKNPSIQVLRNADGLLLWELPSGQGAPMRFPLVIESSQWTGYTFWLSYIGDELVGLDVRRDRDAELLSAQALQRVPLGALHQAAQRCAREFLEAWDEATPRQALTSFYDPLEWVDALADPPIRENDTQLAKLCQRYLELNGEPGWRLTLSVEFAKAESSIPTMISRARRRRFLTRVPRGQYGGQLTPKALQLLAPKERRQALAEIASEQQRLPAGAAQWSFISVEDMTPEQLAIAKDMEQKAKGG